MKLESRHVDSLILDPENLRVHPEKNLATIKASLERFGLQKPVVINSENVVIAGNGVVEAARELGWTELHVVVTDLDSNEQFDFGFVDNRSQDLSDWNYEAVAKAFETRLEEGIWDLEDAKDLGWDPHEIEPLISAEWSVDEDDLDLDDDPDDEPVGSSDFQVLVRRVVDKVREELREPTLAERDALRYSYLVYLEEDLSDYGTE